MIRMCGISDDGEPGGVHGGHQWPSVFVKESGGVFPILLKDRALLSLA